MAVLATGQISIANLGDLRGVIQQVDPPAHPADGALWLNTETRALARWDAGEAQWAPVIDPIASAMIAQLQGETVLNDDFQTLMDNAAHLAQIAGSTELIDNLAQTMGFGPDGLTISSLSGEFAARLGTQQLDFLKGKGAAAVAIAVFGLLKTVTAPYLQVGDPAQGPKLRVGNAILEYQAASGNLTFRRA